MKRDCPYCGKEIEVFAEECASCGKPSKPGLLRSIAAIVHGHKPLILMVALLIVSWIILSKIFNRFL